MTTMRAARLHFSSRELRVNEVARPVLGSREILAKVEAAGEYLSDAHLISGELGALLGRAVDACPIIAVDPSPQPPPNAPWPAERTPSPSTRSTEPSWTRSARPAGLRA